MEVLLQDEFQWGAEDKVFYLLLEGDVDPEALLPDELALLSERHHPRRRKRYCQGRWGVQEALRRAGYTEAVGTPLVMDVQGKPCWGGQGEKPKISFSISHHSMMTLVAVAPERVYVGVDMEMVDPRFERPVDPILTEEERAYLDSLGPAESSERVWGATALWVGKEAVAKATGRGWMAHQQDFPLIGFKEEGKTLTCLWKSNVEYVVKIVDTKWGMLAFAGRKSE